MKQLGFVFFAATALIAAPAAGQALTTAGYDLIDAIKKSDGDKATQVLATHPPGLIDTKDADGNTGLIIAINRSDERWTAFLLNKGADPNLAGKGGDTPLIAASRVGFESAAEWLIGLGAKVDGANPDKTDSAAGYSARDYATRDPRARDILKMITDKKPKGTAAAAK